MSDDRPMPVGVGYETPAASRASAIHGPFHLVPQEPGPGVRITGVYRTVWGRWRRALRFAAGLGLALLLFGTVVDSILGRTLIIDLTRSPPVFTGSAASLLGLVLLALALVGWIIVRAVTWRRLHRLEIDAGPDELIIRQTLPGGEQVAGRWKPAEVERVVAEQCELTVHPRGGGSPVKMMIGGPWTGVFWLADRIGEATGIAVSIVGRETD